MTLKLVYSALTISVAATGAIAWAGVNSCALALGDGVRAGREAEIDRISYDLSHAHFRDIGIAAVNSFLNAKTGEREVIVFLRRASGMDVGYKVYLSFDSRSGDFTMESVEPTDRDDERDYFSRLAARENFRTVRILFSFPIFGRRRVEISPAIQIKLREKHAVTIDEVQQAFYDRRSPLTSESQRGSDKYSFVGRTKGGKRLRIGLVTANAESFVLTSAYQERQLR